MSSQDASTSALRADVIGRLEQAAARVYELEAELSDQTAAIEVLLIDAFHLGLELDDMGEKSHWLLRQHPELAGASERPPGRFARRRLTGWRRSGGP